jgi:hypothetical protein
MDYMCCLRVCLRVCVFINSSIKVSANGFNFDYAEGGDGHYGTAQKRITRRLNHAADTATARVDPRQDGEYHTVRLDDAALDGSQGEAKDANTDDRDDRRHHHQQQTQQQPPPPPQQQQQQQQHHEHLHKHQQEQHRVDPKAALGSNGGASSGARPTCCRKLGTDLMNQNLPSWQPVIVVKWLATALVSQSGSQAVRQSSRCQMMVDFLLGGELASAGCVRSSVACLDLDPPPSPPPPSKGTLSLASSNN